MEWMMLLLLLPLVCLSICNARAQGRIPASSRILNVLNYGARANGIDDDSKAFVAAWKETCSCGGAVKLLIPKGTYLVGPLKFTGPCKSVRSIKVSVKGYLKATTDLSKYVKGEDWVEFAWLDKLTLTGGGTFDGQGSMSWPHNTCSKTKQCQLLPTSIKFVSLNNTVVEGIKSLNSKSFHMALVGCNNFRGKNIKIIAPKDSPNTDGIHIERSSGVTIHNSIIGTGDDCISVGHGNSGMLLAGIRCGPGHGISVGSLGKYEGEEDVSGLVVRDSILSGTTNGVRIKTWEDCPKSISATNMTFVNILMKEVANPIIIDQMYCPYASCASKAPSSVELRDISFINIRGTSRTQEAVTLKCSEGVPCQNVILHDVRLNYYIAGTPATAICEHVRAKFSGTQMIPGLCKRS